MLAARLLPFRAPFVRLMSSKSLATVDEYAMTVRPDKGESREGRHRRHRRLPPVTPLLRGGVGTNSLPMCMPVVDPTPAVTLLRVHSAHTRKTFHCWDFSTTHYFFSPVFMSVCLSFLALSLSLSLSLLSCRVFVSV